jgi:hypothetical protein
MASSPSNLKEFLVALGFRVDEPGFGKFKTTVGQATKAAVDLGEAVAASAAVIGIAVTRISEQFGDLYFATQRVGGSVAGLQAFQFAAARIGLSTDQARAGIEGFSASVRRLPALRGLFQQLTGTAFDPNNPEKSFETLIRRLRSFGAPGTQGYAIGSRFAELFGIPEDQLVLYEKNIDQLTAQQAEYARAQKAAGIDAGELAKNSAAFNAQLALLETNLAMVGDRFWQDIVGPATDAVKWINNLVAAFQRLNVETHGMAGGAATVGGTALGGWVGLKMLRGLLARVGIGGAAAGAEAGAGAGAAGGIGAAGASLFGAGLLRGLLGPLGIYLAMTGPAGEGEDAETAARHRQMAEMSQAERMRFLAGGGASTGGAGGLLATADSMADKFGIPRRIFRALVGIESHWKQGAVSDKGALGLSQLMPDTARGEGVDPSDPTANLQGGASYLSKLYRKWGNWTLALAEYNAGAKHMGYGLGYAAEVLADAEGGVSRGMPQSALIPAGASSGQPVTINQRTQVTVNGATDPHATATAVASAQGNVNNDLVRNLAAVVR